jgi:hypothetical protein
MRYDDEDDAEEYKQQIGLAQGGKKKSKFGDFLKWYFTVDFKDWTNYVALAIAGFLFWWGIKTIMSSMTLT